MLRLDEGDPTTAAVRALIESGRVLFWARDEQYMLNEVCRILVERVAYRLAWIGFGEHDANRTVQPVASYGVTDYLDGLFVSWDPTTKWGRGPTGTAVRDGTIQIVAQADTDERYRPWADRAKQYDILSACALPFDLPNGSRGALNLYAAEPDRFTEQAIGLLSEVASGIAQAVSRIRETVQLADSLRGTVESLSTAVELRDPFTAGHQARVSALCRAIGTTMELPAHEVDGIALAAEVHDIGKLAVPVEILTTPNLALVEYELIKTHAERGYEILDGINFPWPLPTWVRQHHERLNGSGYPRGLRGDEILPGSRILAVADVVESMVSYRPYRMTTGVTAALSEIQANAGRLYDPDAVDACLTVVRGGWSHFAPGPPVGHRFNPRARRGRYADSDEIGDVTI